MRKWLWIPALAALVLSAASAEARNTKVGLTYSLLVEQKGTPVATGFLDGFDSGDGFRIRVKPTQDCYAYLIVQRNRDDFRLLFPDQHTRRGWNRLPKKKEFVWPQDGWLRLDKKTGIERLYLIVSSARISELEARFALAAKTFPESVVIDIRDRYQDDSSYLRKVDDEQVTVRFNSRNREQAVLIEEIALRHL